MSLLVLCKVDKVRPDRRSLKSTTSSTFFKALLKYYQVVELYKDISASFEDLGKEGDGNSAPTPTSAA